MQYKLGAKVYTSDNHQVGTVDHIVLDPEEKSVTHLVVRKGMLFGKDKVIPVDAVQSEVPDGLILQQTSTDLDTFPDFEERLYTGSGDGMTGGRTSGGSAGGASYLAGGAPMSVSPGDSLRTVTKVRNIPDNAVPLKVGSKVITNDGRHIGNIERVITDEGNGKAKDLVISQGLLTKTRKQIPAEWITELVEDEVFLNVDASFIQALPEYFPEMQA